jgi:N-acetylglucosamine-6-phosphate deacetylase
MQFAGIGMAEAVKLASSNPARVAGIAGRKGSLMPGADADMVALSRRGEVLKTIVRGQGA